ncbi:MAG: hypothetical protein ACM359_00020 [Bacillota bacterium]
MSPPSPAPVTPKAITTANPAGTNWSRPTIKPNRPPAIPRSAGSPPNSPASASNASSGPLIVLSILAFLALGWFVPKTGQVLGACLLVLGSALIVICTIWLFVIPFRDGANVGLSCILSGKRRRRWAADNPDFNLRRPTSLVMTGLCLVLLAALFFALWIISRQYWGLS